MRRLLGMAIGMALATASAPDAGAQWRPVDVRTHNFIEYGVPDTGENPNAYYVTTSQAMPPTVYARRATPGGLIATAARRINPLSAPSQAGGLSFAPSMYQPGPTVATGARRFRPVFGSGPRYGHGPGTHGHCGNCPR